MNQNDKTPERVKGIVWPLWIVVIVMLAMAAIAFPQLPDPHPHALGI